MSYKIGQLIDHLDIRVSDFAASGEFYRTILTTLGFEGIDVGDDRLSLDELYITASASPEEVTRNLHLCFQAASRDQVEEFHAAGLAHGGRDNGAPGLRDYHPGYYAAFLLDPDGNNIEAKVDERILSRSAPAIDIETN
ncbi:VOC family protein [Pseudoroseicyclus sp. H15]